MRKEEKQPWNWQLIFRGMLVLAGIVLVFGAMILPWQIVCVGFLVLFLAVLLFSKQQQLKNR
ncbi:MAG TPA: hypothetical protein PLS49_06305 [Candidatus Woesebacteria bacterium]|nr:hypothetical protein [Candidatus Woesebacteria bacterium]